MTPPSTPQPNKEEMSFQAWHTRTFGADSSHDSNLCRREREVWNARNAEVYSLQARIAELEGQLTGCMEHKTTAVQLSAGYLHDMVELKQQLSSALGRLNCITEILNKEIHMMGLAYEEDLVIGDGTKADTFLTFRKILRNILVLTPQPTCDEKKGEG